MFPGISPPDTSRRIFIWSLGLILFFVVISFSAVVAVDIVFERWLGITSDNAVLYLIRDGRGISVTNDLHFDQTDRLLFMLDFSCIFNLVREIEAVVMRNADIEVTWDGRKGEGVIKEYRPDGTKFLAVFGQCEKDRDNPDGSIVKGLFIGGDLHYGDVDYYRDGKRNAGGMAYYDGSRWNHLWSAAKETVKVGSLAEFGRRNYSITVSPWNWEYLGGSLLRQDSSKVIIESRHRMIARASDGTPLELTMKRTVLKSEGEDYVVFRVEFINTGGEPLLFSYTFAETPWIGDYGTSAGDVGWTAEGSVKMEAPVFTARHTFAGFWDIGNPEVFEKGPFTGAANFIDWSQNPPVSVYFSNKQEFDYHSLYYKQMPLAGEDTRGIYLLWNDETLYQGGSKKFVYAVGMAKAPDMKGLPAAPKIDYARVY